MWKTGEKECGVRVVKRGENECGKEVRRIVGLV